MLSSLSKLIFKVTLVICLLIGLSALALHIWFVNNARDVLKEIVTEKSEGKFRLELSQLTFDFFSNTMQARIADISSTDTINQPVTYHVKFRRLTLHVGSFWPLLFKNNLVLDSIKLHNPQIEVKQWHSDTSFSNQELSLPQEMGRMYHSMLDVLDAFGIRRIQISNARLTLTNKMKPASVPVSISGIYMDLFKTPNERVEGGGIADESQSIDLRTQHQSIELPGGRHRLAFKNFHLQLFRKRIELDSCTITAKTTDSARSSYKIFFSKLMLTGVDFDAMYRRNLIKADSVYCENPLFEIQLDRYKTAVTTKERPDANKIIRELTGDLDLAFVGVKDAGIRIDISGKTRRSLYNANRDDFEMHGLRINTDSAMPVSVDRFNMLVRDYHLYNEDSSATYSFDSIHFVNNKIRLSNFSAETGSSSTQVHNKRDFKIRLFELSGLDWYELVFNETLKAREAYLYDPVISFVKRRSATAGKKINLFAALQSFDDFMTLDKITVVNGNLDMKLSDEASVDLERVNFSLYSNQLLKSVDREGIRDAVDHFSFGNGLLKFKDITANLEQVRYTGESLVHAERARVASEDKRINATLNDLYIDNLVVDDDASNVFVEGVRWGSARLQFLSPAVGVSGAGKGNHLVIKNMNVKNTAFSYVNGPAAYGSYISDLQLLSYSNDRAAAFEGLRINGEQLSVKNQLMQLTASTYQLNDQSPSFLSAVKGYFYKGDDSISLTTSSVAFVPHVNNMLHNDYYLGDVSLNAPVLKAVSRRQVNEDGSSGKPFPFVRIDKLHIAQPVMHIASYRADTASVLNIPFSKNSAVNASGFRSDSTGIYLQKLQFNTAHASFISRKGDQLGIEEGKLSLQLSNLHFAIDDGKPKWNAIVDNVHIGKPQQLLKGKKKNLFTVQQAELGNFMVSSDFLKNTDLFIQKNINAWLSNTTGEYIDSISTYKWYNAAYKGGRLSVDSLVYFPTRERDSLVAGLPYQKDYITTHTGAIVITGFRPEVYQKDSSIIADEILIAHPLITVFRDKQPPFLSGVVKPLPVDMIRKVTQPVLVSRVHVKDGKLSYTEKNAKSRQEGTITLTEMDLLIENLRNQQISPGDSLRIIMNALLLDSASLNLSISQAYQDSLKSFLMTLRVKPTSLLFLNPVLTPLSNVKIVSGKIDSLHLTAIGREHLAFGKMNMFYRDLRIQLVKDGDPDKKDLKSRMLSFLANTFIIKRNNNGRTGLVYFERLRDRSFFNYIVKMTFSGMATSIGVKKNRKYMKQYKKAMKERGTNDMQVPVTFNN
jgi:hypothetical protein